MLAIFILPGIMYSSVLGLQLKLEGPDKTDNFFEVFKTYRLYLLLILTTISVAVHDFPWFVNVKRLHIKPFSDIEYTTLQAAPIW